MELELRFSGEIVERQELLNGTQMITIECASTDGGWTLVGSVSWNRGLVDYAGEGDLSLMRGGDELFATLVEADVRDARDEAAADHVMRLIYDVDGGAGDFAGAGGRARVELTVAGEGVEGNVALTLDPGTS